MINWQVEQYLESAKEGFWLPKKQFEEIIKYIEDLENKNLEFSTMLQLFNIQLPGENK